MHSVYICGFVLHMDGVVLASFKASAHVVPSVRGCFWVLDILDQQADALHHKVAVAPSRSVIAYSAENGVRGITVRVRRGVRCVLKPSFELNSCARLTLRPSDFLI